MKRKGSSVKAVGVRWRSTVWYHGHMVRSKRPFLHAMFSMTGTIVGAGVFGLPAVFSRIGLAWGTLLYLGLACVVAAMHLLYVEVHLASGGSHRLGGLAHRILGPFGGSIASITYPFHIFGTNLIYTLLAGTFLASLAGHVGLAIPVQYLQLAYWLVVAIFVYRGLRRLARLEEYATWILIVLLGCLSAAAWILGTSAIPSLLFAWDGNTVPLGVLLFSLTGLPVVGEVIDLVGRNRSQAYQAVVCGTLLAALLSWIFGVSWAMLTTSLGSGMVLGPHASSVIQVAGWLFPLMGFFAVITSQLTSTTDLFLSFERDFKWRKHMAWVVATVPTLLLLFVVKQDLLRLMDTVGGIFSAFNAALVCLMALTLSIRSPQRTNWVIGVSALLTGAIFMAVLIQKLNGFTLSLI